MEGRIAKVLCLVFYHLQAYFINYLDHNEIKSWFEILIYLVIC